MKKLFSSILFVVALCFMASCSKSDEASSDKTQIVVDLESDMTFKTSSRSATVSRAINESVYKDITNYNVKLSKVGGEVVYSALYKDWALSYEVIPGQQYKLEAYYGESSPASFDNLYIYGSETFSVQPGSTKRVGFQCKPQAIKVNVAYSNDFAEYFSDCIVSFKTKHMDMPFTMSAINNKNNNDGNEKDLYLQSDAEETVELAFDIKDKTGNSVSPEGFANNKQVTVSSQTLLKINISPNVTEVEGGKFGINITVNTDVIDEDVNIEIPSAIVE